MLLDRGSSPFGRVSSDKAQYGEDFGKFSIESDQKITPETITGIGSITKQFTVATLLKIWDEEINARKAAKNPIKTPETETQDPKPAGARNFPKGMETKFASFMPRLKERYCSDGENPECLAAFERFEKDPNFDNITLRDLLNHTHGLGGRNNHQSADQLLKNGGNPVSLPEIASISEKYETTETDASGNKIKREIGLGEFEYSNLGCDLAAMVIEVATGKEFDEAVKEKVLRPLELTSTVMQSDNRTLLETGKLNGSEVQVAKGMFATDDTQWFSTKFVESQPGFFPEGKEERQLLPWSYASNTRGAGGMKSTLKDLEKFGENFMSGKMFENAKVRSALQNRAERGYHFAIQDFENGQFGHGGDDCVYRGILAFDPKSQQTSVMLEVVENISHGIAIAAFKEIYGESEAEELKKIYHIFIDDGGELGKEFKAAQEAAGFPRLSGEGGKKLINNFLDEHPEQKKLIKKYQKIRAEAQTEPLQEFIGNNKSGMRVEDNFESVGKNLATKLKEADQTPSTRPTSPPGSSAMQVGGVDAGLGS